MSTQIAVLSSAHIHTRGFMRNLADKEDRTPYAVWDDVADRGKRYAAEFDSTFVADLDELLAAPTVDGFMICAENTRHLDLLKKALATGKPVFCEKPLVTTDEDLADLRALLAKHPDATLMSGYFQPFGGTMRTIRRMVEDDVFGKVTHARFRNAHHAAYGRWFDNPDLNWFFDTELSGGGAFMDMGTHAVHLMTTLFGKAKSVQASISNKSGEYPTADDYGLAIVEFENGVTATVEAAWVQTGGIIGLEVVGRSGCVYNDGSKYVAKTDWTDPTPVKESDAKPSGPDRLVAAIQGKLTEDELKDDLKACLEAVAVMAAAYRSAESGRAEEVK